jgi:nucleoid-associated protein YgaU
VLTVQMGAGTGPGRIEHKAILKSVSVTYTRFTSTSVPSRAVLSLTLQGADVPVPKQNPTSGGPPGGRVHTVIAGDNLQRIATASYGSPSSWRRIAEANDVDDPLRVRNGHPVYLPAR